MNPNSYISEETAELRLLRPGSGPLSPLQDYWELVKPEITFQVMLAALAGFILGTSGKLTLQLLALTMIGTTFASAGAGVLNHYVERHNDALMRRTSQRPLPSGRINPRSALGFGITLTLIGVTLLWWVNLITLILAALTVFLYLFAYTPLKRRTTYNTLIGTIPGALPALGATRLQREPWGSVAGFSLECLRFGRFLISLHWHGCTEKITPAEATQCSL